MSKVKGRAAKAPVDEAPKSAYPAYPETMMANSLLKEGMDDRVVEALLTKGHCKVAGLVVLSGMTNRDLANMTNLHELALKNRRNIEFIRTALVKLRIDIPPPHPSFLASMDAFSAAVSAPPPPSQQQQKPSPPTPPPMPQPAPPSESKGSGGTLPTDKPDPVSEHDRMLDVLKEFPVAYEQYIKDNGGLAKPSSSTVLSTKPEDELQDVGFLCGAIPTTSLWTALAEALGFFGLGSDQKEFQSVDQIVGEFCTSTGLPTIKGPFHPKARSKGKAKAKKKLGPLEPNAAPTLPPLQLVPTDWTARDSAGAHLRNESRRLFKIFSGITRGEGIPTFNWEFKLTKSRVTVHQAMVPDSPWAAIKSDCIVHADKDRIRKLITDDLRSHEYDPSVETYEILHQVDDCSRIRHYRFKPIFPTAPRDFVFITSWCELEDGCVMVSSLSPPIEYMGKASGYTRAYLMSSGALLRPIESRLGGGTHVTFVTHADPGGSVPAFVLNMLSTGTPVGTLSRVCEICEKEEREEQLANMQAK